MVLVVVDGMSVMCPRPVVCWVAVHWGGIASFDVFVTMFGYFSMPGRLFLLFLPVVSSVELIEGLVISLWVVLRTCYNGAEFPSQAHSSCQNPWWKQQCSVTKSPLLSHPGVLRQHRFSIQKQELTMGKVDTCARQETVFRALDAGERESHFPSPTMTLGGCLSIDISGPHAPRI